MGESSERDVEEKDQSESIKQSKLHPKRGRYPRRRGRKARRAFVEEE